MNDEQRSGAVERGLGQGVSFLRTAAFVTIVVAGLKLAGPLLIPVIVAAFVAIVCAPAVRFLVDKHVPSGLAVALVLVFVLGSIVLLSVAVADQLTELTADLPVYKEKLHGYYESLTVWLEGKGVNLTPPEERSPIDPDRLLSMAGSVAGTAANAVSTVLLLLLLVAFMLGEASGLPAKIRRALGTPDASLGELEEVGRQVWAYLGVKTAIGLLTGLLFAVFLSIMDIPYAVLWGLLAFLLNFIPNIGSLIAAIPPVLLALLTKDLGTAAIVAGGNVAINQVLGNIVEPKWMGSRLGLSPLVVFLSLVFWSWLWGPVGMLLSVPLTMVVKILLENSEDLRWVAVLLGPSGEVDEAEAAPATSTPA